MIAPSPQLGLGGFSSFGLGRGSLSAGVIGGGGADPLASAQLERVIADGGQVTNDSIIQALFKGLRSKGLLTPYAFYSAQSVKVESGQVSKVYDISGNGRDAARAASLQTMTSVNGVSAIAMINSGKSFATTGTALAQQYTWFAIYRRSTTGLRVIAGDAAGFLTTGNAQFGRTLQVGASLVRNEAENQMYLVGGRAAGASSRLTRNGILRVSGNSGANGMTNFALGGTPNNGSVIAGECVMWGVWQNITVDQENDIAGEIIKAFEPVLRLKPLVICDGNSLTNGSGASVPANNYPNQLWGLLGGAGVVELYNYGVNGQTTAQMIADAATQIDADYLTQRNGKNIVVAWEIRNHMVGSPTPGTGVAKEVAYASYVSYCQSRRTAGFKVCAVTVLPSKDLSNTDRAWVNLQIRSNYLTFSDALADVAADLNIGPDGANLNLTYYVSDQIHITDAGYTIIATIVKAALMPLLA